MVCVRRVRACTQLFYTKRLKREGGREGGREGPETARGSAGALRDAETFVTARGSQGTWRLAWSFFAGSLGAWAITGPAAYAVHAGILGCSAYALSCGLPTLFVVHFGPHVQAAWPSAGSLAEFAELRFGARAKGVVLGITMLNMCVGLLAELTTIGALFRDFVGGGALPMILVSALLATCYTAYGGLLVSIVTDQLQALFSLVLILAVTVYTAATFRRSLPGDLGPMGQQLGPGNAYGISSLFVMPVCLLASTVFSQAVWQRVWAAQSAMELRLGGTVACVAVVLTVFLFGMAGFLAAWGGLINPARDDPNLYLFQLFKSHETDRAQVRSSPPCLPPPPPPPPLPVARAPLRMIPCACVHAHARACMRTRVRACVRAGCSSQPHSATRARAAHAQAHALPSFYFT